MFAGPGPSSQMSHIELGLSEQSVLTSSVDLAGDFFNRNSHFYLVDGSGHDCSLCTSANSIFLMCSETFYCFGCRLINVLHCFLFCLMDVMGTMSIF